MIQVSDLVKRYGTFEAVRGVSFSVDTGGVVGLLGPNGAGKTTIMKVLTGYHRPSAGSASLDGIDVVDDPLAAKSLVGYLPEGVPLYLDMSVHEYLGFMAEARGIPKADREAAMDKAMTACGLTGVAGVRLEKLSKGYRQRAGLAQAILHEPSILILDEPTTGLDPNQILEIRSLIRSLGQSKTVILSTHILQEVEALCSRVLILNEGKIVAQGSAAEIAAGMSGSERLECTVKGRASAMFDSLRGMPGIQTVTGMDDHEDGMAIGADTAAGGRTAGQARFTVNTVSGQGDSAAESVFDWAAGNGLKLLEMRRERLSMEDIFVRLTTEEAAV